MDDLEREDIVEEPLEEEALEEITVDEVPGEDAPEDDAAVEEPVEEQPPKKPAKPKKPVKGPGLVAWLLALLVMLFGLVMLIPSIWNTVLGLPALGGLLSEAGRNYDTAMTAYEFLYTTDMSAQGWGLPGLNSGGFPEERQFAIWGKRYGPLFLVQSQDVPSIAEYFERTPKSLRKLEAQCDEIGAILGDVNQLLGMQGAPAEGQSRTEWLLAALITARAADKQSEARKNYYDAIILQATAGDPAHKKDNLARIAALQKNRAAEPWMYEEAAFSYALEDADYAGLVRVCEARLKHDRESTLSMESLVRALYLSGEEGKAFARADKYAKRSSAGTAMRLARAELYYRQGKYGQAIAECDAVLEEVNFYLPVSSSAQMESIQNGLAATEKKAVALLLQGKPEEASELLNGNWAAAAMNQISPNLSFAYALLSSYILAGDEEGAAELSEQLEYYGIPQAVADLQAGKTTIEQIYTEGWGGFDV